MVARRVTPRTVRNVLRCMRQTPQFFPDAYRRLRFGTRPMGTPVSYTLYARAEQSPNYNSRLLLSNEKDHLGVRRVNLDWRTSEIDHRAVPALVELIKEEFARLKLGQVQAHDWVRDGYWPDPLVGGPHHIGTTRMADNPKEGVVDRNAKVHGLDGLYLAGSSVFPTGGHANSTLTLLATTLRLCAHLESKLAIT